MLQQQHTGEDSNGETVPSRPSALSSDSVNISFDAVLEQVCRLLHGNSGGSVSSASTPRKPSLEEYPLPGLVSATQIAVTGCMWLGEDRPFARTTNAATEGGEESAQQQQQQHLQQQQQQLQQLQQQQQQQRTSGRSRTQGRTKYGRPHNRKRALFYLPSHVFCLSNPFLPVLISLLCSPMSGLPLCGC